MATTVSTRGLVEIASHEGIVPMPYFDSVGVLTFGIGHTRSAGAITLANNTHVAGVNVRGVGDFTIPEITGNRAIYSPGDLNNIVLEQLDIRNLGDDAIRFEDGNSNVKILYSKFADLSADGIEFEEFNRNITIMDVELRETRFRAIDFQAAGGNDNVLISNSDDRVNVILREFVDCHLSLLMTVRPSYQTTRRTRHVRLAKKEPRRSGEGQGL